MKRFMRDLRRMSLRRNLMMGLSHPLEGEKKRVKKDQL